ncbi:glycerophosphodiester phosphodiesterase family protein [Biformimicrobium ophioploci]|uniref:GP-PDE domain-containing protein n=1 Tax=Biformimicrobium ophioploci TaxID=3036711 RepID=A0ABQ6LZ37_9GAMM|nr:glycerophosphodiester phosphodiesterase family protein [Microbulbifer sp. NKW57]GMG87305.1 hypothetical protein MNKW57_16260 [Microbulbifer sp. NKW57]
MLIAHRGNKIQQPENTISSFESAHGLGTCAIETDIQMSADGTPWCFHDDDLLRVAGRPEKFFELEDTEIAELRIDGAGLATARELIDWVGRHPHLDCFLELKPSSLGHFGFELVIEHLARILPKDTSPFIVVTRDCESLRFARSRGCHRVGLNIKSLAECLRPEVVTLAPDYLFIRDSRVNADELPPGPWQWVVYEVNEPEQAVEWSSRGAHHILTGDLPRLMRSREASNVYGL